MKKLMLLLSFALSLGLGSSLQAQPAAAAPVTTQKIFLLKVAHGKNQEWIQLMRDVSMKAAQVRADAGEIISWTILRSVYPAGEEARADFMISEISAGNPHTGGMKRADTYKAAGITLTPAEFDAKRDALATLVASELWRPRIYHGSAHKGDYLMVNYMKVSDEKKYAELEKTIWSPLAQEWIKQGAMTGWLYATKMLPAGSETVYSTRTVDMYPSLEAAFADRKVAETFAKVHPGEKFDEVMGNITKVRDLGRRELWTVVERVTKKQP